jgi:hypothetical protein
MSAMDLTMMDGGLTHLKSIESALLNIILNK